MRRSSDPTPLYHRIYVGLRGEILGGTYAKGERLPSEASLKDRFGVARVTVRSALSRLENEGLVSRLPGRGTICLFDPTVTTAKEPIRGMIENLISMGLDTSVSLLEAEFTGAGPEVAGHLDLAPGDRVHRAVRVRSREGVPFSHLTTHVPGGVADQAELEELGVKPLLLLLEEGGQIITEADQWITASAATGDVAELLQVPEGSPLLNLTRLVFAQERRAVELLNALYRPDMYQFSLSLARQQGVKTGQWVPFQ